MLILGIDHAAIKTSRLDESRSFYTEVLGLREGPRPAFEFDGAWLYAGEHDVVHLVETDQAGALARGVDQPLRLARGRHRRGRQAPS